MHVNYPNKIEIFNNNKQMKRYYINIYKLESIYLIKIVLALTILLDSSTY